MFSRSKLRFGVYLRAIRVKKLKGKSYDGIYLAFNQYCKNLGYTEDFSTPYSFGGIGWRHPVTRSFMTLRQE